MQHIVLTYYKLSWAAAKDIAGLVNRDFTSCCRNPKYLVNILQNVIAAANSYPTKAAKKLRHNKKNHDKINFVILKSCRKLNNVEIQIICKM